MRRSFYLLIIIILGGLFGSWLKDWPGFVIVAYEKTTYEMRLWFAIALVVLAAIILLLLIVLIRWLLSSFTSFKSWTGTFNWRRSRKKTIDGMLAFSEGRWQAAENAMVTAAKNSDTKLINYLIAAQAAQQQNAAARRDAYIRQAHKAEPDAKVAIGLTQARLQLQHEQYEQALASLKELRSQNASHPYVLKLLCRLFEILQDWEQMLELLPHLKKHKVFEELEQKRIEENTVEGLLIKLGDKDGISAVEKKWQELPTGLKNSRENILTYAGLLVQYDKMNEAEQMLKPLIKKNVDASVLALYGKVITDPVKQLTFLETWSRTAVNAPREVFLTMGKIAFNAKLWGKAKDFLEQAILIKPSAESYLMMAKTLEKLDSPSEAARYYKKGLEFAGDKNHQVIIHP
ncbi:MAG: heme biosynthesis protein HemY [Gammaproteobacteria bacterium]|nr:heme biosynthesis protein HemY [Gammaproteobacteria bacterium]MDH5630335.1 heme biosynthesis protein HemY [Gammaproteobacteria bacterium]